MTKSEVHLKENAWYRSEVRPTDCFINVFNLMKVKRKNFNSRLLLSHVKTKN